MATDNDDAEGKRGNDMPNFFLLQGGLGAGKTLTATILAHYWRVRSGGDVRLFGNYPMHNATVFDSPERWLDVAEARGSVIVWDEAQIQFDRRTWARNTFLTQILNYSRKLRAVHVFVNPVGGNLDQRILDFVEIMIHVRKSQGRGISLDIYEYQDKRFGEWGRLLKHAYIPWRMVQQIFKLELYDTDAILYPFQSPKTERDQQQLLEQMITVQREAAAREHEEGKEKHTSGWINPSDGRELLFRDKESHEEESQGSELFVPFDTRVSDEDDDRSVV